MSVHPSTTQLSIRASCERCRLHKLKCIASSPHSLTSEGRCQRCIRAATECVFSRRNNSKRSQTSLENPGSPSQKNTLPTPGQDGSALMLPTTLFNLDETQNDNPGLQFSGSNTPFLPHNSALDCDMDFIAPSFHYQLPLQSLNSQPLHLTHGLGLNPEAETAGLTGDNAFSPALEGSSASSTLSPSTISDGQQTYPRRVATKSLLTLAMTLEESLDKLVKQTREQEDSRSDFDHYPVGSVLHVFQEFIDTIGGLKELRSRDHLHYDQLDFKHGRFPFCQLKADELTTRPNTTPFAKSTSQLDTSLVLLVLSCYATLTRIGDIVLGHFKQHLEGNTGQRDDQPATVAVSKCGFTAATRLGELAMRAGSYTQIHATVSLLLELLEKATSALAPLLHHPTSRASSKFDVALAIEAQMQLADERTAPLCSCLREGAAGLLSSFAEREENSSELKDLLRKKMGL